MTNALTPDAPQHTPAVQQLEGSLKASLADTPYLVSFSSTRADTIEVYWNAVDQKWKSLLQSHSIKIEQGLRITVDETSHRYRLNDAVIRHWTDSEIGPAGFGYHKGVSASSGRLIQHSYQFSRSVGITKHPDGDTGLATSDVGTYAFTTTGMRNAVVAAMVDAGWTGKPGLSTTARWGIAAACFGGVVALAGAAVAVVVATAS